MKILHITAHMGGGIGTVISSWLSQRPGHTVACLDYLNDKYKAESYVRDYGIFGNMLKEPSFLVSLIEQYDIVVVHYWDSPFLRKLFSYSLPESRMVFWCHKVFMPEPDALAYPDKIIGTSPIQSFPEYIWSTGDMQRFLSLKPVPHDGFNVGYIGTVDYKKMHPEFIDMCLAADIPDAHFYVIGENKIGGKIGKKFTFTGKVDDVAPYLARLDVLGYPLRRNHYGTCEQVIGEAMCAGVVPVCLNNDAESTIIDHEENGFLAVDEADYIRKIEYLARHRVRLKAMSERSRIDGAKIYSIDRMVWLWDEIFGQMMLKEKTFKRPL